MKRNIITFSYTMCVIYVICIIALVANTTALALAQDMPPGPIEAIDPYHDPYSIQEMDRRDMDTGSSIFISTTMDLVGREPFGGAFAIYTVGNTAYLGAGGSLVTLDVGNPSSPQQLGRIDTPGICYGVYVSGDYAYVADGGSGLRVIDISNPSNPHEVGFYDTPGYACGVYVSGNYAYLADNWWGLRVIDIFNPSSPHEVGFYDTPGYAYGVYVSGNYAYVADSGSGLRVIDILNPSNPHEVGFYDTPGSAYGVHVDGNYAYVADYRTGLRVIDVTNPSNPHEVGFFDTPGSAYGVYVAENYAYVADMDSGLQVIDISSPTRPQREGSFITRGCSQSVYVSGNYAYIANSGIGLSVMDVSNPSSPHEVGFYDTPGYALGVHVAGNYAYVADGGSGLRVIDILNPSSPHEVGFYDTPGSAYGVHVDGNYAYVADYRTGLRVIDVTNPSNPHEVGFYDTPGYACGVYASGNYAYVADYEGGLRVVDVSDPTKPEEIGFYDFRGLAWGVYAVGNYVYVTDSWAGLRVVDATDPSNPHEVGMFSAEYASGIYVAGSYAYITDGSIRVINISDPATPRMECRYYTPYYTTDVYVSNGHIYATDGYCGLCILRYNGPVAAADISLSRSSYDYVYISLGSHADWDLGVFNIGGEDLTVESVTSSNPAAFSVLSPTFPQVIPPGDYLNVRIRFSPPSDGYHGGNLIITSSDPDEHVVYTWLSGNTCAGDSYEPDDDSTQAKQQMLNTTSDPYHSICPTGDVDWVSFVLPGPSDVTIQTSGLYKGDTEMWLYNSSMQQIAYDADSNWDRYSQISRTQRDALPGGTYYLKVAEYGNDATIRIYYVNLRASNAWMREWLQLGPFPGPVGEGNRPTRATTDYLSGGANAGQPIQHEYDVYPSWGDVFISQGGAEHRWTRVESNQNGVDYNSIWGQLNDCVMYSVIYVRSTVQQNAYFRGGSDDSIFIYLNSQEVHRRIVGRGWGTDQFGPGVSGNDDMGRPNTCQVTLLEGWNRIMLKVEQGGGGYGHYFQICDENKQGIPGLEYSLYKPDQPESVSLISPNGGEFLRSGGTCNITWAAPGSGIHHIHLLYSTDDGNTYPNTIVASTENDGLYSWALPVLESTTVRVKAIAEDSSNNELASDTSDSSFTVSRSGYGSVVGIWRFDEGNGDIARDSSGNGNDGELNGGIEWVDGRFSKALRFNGVDSFVGTGQRLLEKAKEFTILLWVNKGNLTTNRIGLVGQNDAVEFGFVEPGVLSVWTMNAGSLNVNYPFPEGEWHHVVVTGSTSFLRIYIDGQLGNERVINVADHGSSSFTVNIGGGGVWNSSGNWFNGAIDEVAIFNLALTEDEIKAIMNRGLKNEVYSMKEGWSLFCYSVNKCFYSGEQPTDQPSCVELVNVNDLGYSSLADWFSSVMTPDDAWQMVIGTNGAMDISLPGIFHTLKYVSPIYSYWLKIRDGAGEATITLSGWLYDPGCAIPLLEGWNMAGCPLGKSYYDTEDPPPDAHVPEGIIWEKVDPPVADHVFASIQGKYDLILTDAGAHDPALPPVFSSLHFVGPGYGLWVKMKEPADLIYLPVVQAAPPLAYAVQPDGIPSSVRSSACMLIYGNIECDGEKVEAGTRVQAFSQSGILCGEVIVEHPGCYGLMKVYGDDPKTPQAEGAATGEMLTFYVNGEPAASNLAPEIRWLGDKTIQNISLVVHTRNRPQRTMLGQNYPNPFNPDTWIPYQLKDDAEVVIRIYDISGKLVRTLDLGQRVAGFYMDKEKAAYWDGRNAAGEHIASGVYFYSIQAGSYSATRKMIVIR